MMSLSDIRIHRVSRGSNLDGADTSLAIWQHNSLIKNILISFDGDAEKTQYSNVFANSKLIYL